MQKILIVEDDREMNQGICYILEKAGFLTISAYSIADAKKQYKKITYK